MSLDYLTCQHPGRLAARCNACFLCLPSHEEELKHLWGNQVWLTDHVFCNTHTCFCNFPAVASELQRSSALRLQSWWSVMCQMNQLPSPPLFSSVLCELGCGVTGELALPLACHLPSPIMESRGGGGVCVCVWWGELLHYLLPPTTLPGMQPVACSCLPYDRKTHIQYIWERRNQTLYLIIA